jgi:flavin reductase (DIM6/NTAB) family NADH-FMN oxidoreductase RutF
VRAASLETGLDRQFLHFMSSYFTSVSIVTSIDSEGIPHGMTCTSLTSVTLDPPTLLVCLNKGTGTLKAVVETLRFAVNILDSAGTDVARSFSSSSPDRFQTVNWTPSPSAGQPWLTDCALATAECETSFTRDVGTHTVVFGRVTSLKIGEEFPLLYGRRSYHNVGSVI